MKTIALLLTMGIAAMTCYADNDGIHRSNPPGVFDPGNKFSQLVSVKNRELLFFSGQVALNEQGELVGENDLRKQTVQVFENIKALLKSRDTDFTSLVRLTIYIVNYQSEDRFILHEVQHHYIPPGKSPASTLLGVQTLARPGLLIEIDGVAAID